MSTYGALWRGSCPETAKPRKRFHPAVTILGSACEKARNIASEVGPVIELPKVVAAGKRAFRNEPSGFTMRIGRRIPALCGMSGLISIRNVSSRAEAVADWGALTKPGVCGEDPEKSNVTCSPRRLTARLIFIFVP